MVLKEVPEDFYVKEILDLPLSTGPFFYYLLKKRDWTTFDAVQALAQKLHLPLKCFGYAGTKDKRAITEQYLSVYKTSKEKMERIALRDITLKYLGTGKTRISLGTHRGNYFQIVVRDLSTKPQIIPPSCIKNFFDSQRFGTTGDNYLIGKALVQGNFHEASTRLHMTLIQNDAIRTLRTIDRKMLRFYISAYQSYLWNIVAADIEDATTLPLVGFLTEFSSRTKKKYLELLKIEGITPKDFLIPKIPELANEGDERPLYITVTNFASAIASDERHPGKYKLTFRFQLPKGAYATHVVKTLFPSQVLEIF